MNKLICGDNLEELVRLTKESVDLIYIDPPFFTHKRYEVVWGNELINAEGDNKISKAKKDIYKYLSENKNNYFVNTAGFINLLQLLQCI